MRNKLSIPINSFTILFLLLIAVCSFVPSAYAQVIDPQVAKVTLTFDDGFASTYNYALPILSQRGIPATEFVATSFIDKGVTGDGLPAMTWQQVQNLQNQYGWEIGSHTVTHPELPTVSLSQQKTEIANSKSVLAGKGLQVTSFATPYGAYDNNGLIEIAKSYNLHRGFWDRDALNTYPYDRSVIMVQSVETGVSYTTVKGWIDQAISQKKWLVLVFHEVKPALNPNYEYTITTQELTQIADYIKQTNIKAVTMNHTLQKPGPNLVTNSTFASGINNGWTTDNATQIQANTANNGSYPSPVDAVKLTGSPTASHLFSPSIPANPAATYTLQVFVNNNAVTSGQTGFYIDEYNTSGAWISGKNLGSVPAGGVKYFSILYKPSSTAVSSFKIQTFMTANTKGTAYVDNFELYNLNGVNPTPTQTPTQTPTPTTGPSVTPTTTPTATPTTKPSTTPTTTPTVTPTTTPTPTPTGTPVTNLAVNGSFESLTNGWANNWSKDSNNFAVDTTSNGNSGTNSLHLTPNSVYAHLFSDRITVNPSLTYTWKQYIRTVKAGGEFGFYIDEYDTNGNWVSGQWKGNITAMFTGTKQFSYKPSNTKVKTIRLQYYAVPNSTFDLYMDSVVLSQ